MEHRTRRTPHRGELREERVRLRVGVFPRRFEVVVGARDDAGVDCAAPILKEARVLGVSVARTNEGERDAVPSH